MSTEKGSSLPRFGDWDVNNPASAEGFTVIFNKARDDKKVNANPLIMPVHPHQNMGAYNGEISRDFPEKNGRWFCCF